MPLHSGPLSLTMQAGTASVEAGVLLECHLAPVARSSGGTADGLMDMGPLLDSASPQGRCAQRRGVPALEQRSVMCTLPDAVTS